MPLNDKTTSVLRGWQATRTDQVFYNPETGGRRRNRGPLSNAPAKTELHDVTWHALRHTFASRLSLAPKTNAVRRLNCDKTLALRGSKQKTA
jgi:hypothetical protein